MKLLVIRHAIAMDRSDFQKMDPQSTPDDDLRPLTKAGISKMRQSLKGLRKLVEGLDVFASSPLVRAVQTAELVSEAYQGQEFEIIEAMRPERHPSELLKWLKTLDPSTETVAVVGHEPHLSKMISWMLTGKVRPIVEIKKGGVCQLDFPSELVGGRATMSWLLKPSHLRMLK